MRTSLFALAASCACALVACEESIELGSQCESRASLLGCAERHPGGEVSIVRYPDAGAGSEAAGADAGAGSAVGATSGLGGIVGQGTDASVATRSSPLLIANPSFERNGGVGGDVLLDKLISLFPLVNLIFADLPSWYACFPLAVSSVTLLDSPDAGVQPSPTGDHLSFAINGTSVRQELQAPMVAGNEYAFAFDVLTDEPLLYLEARGATELCGDGVVLGRSAVLPTSTSWTEACVSFRADQAYGYLLLAPGSEGATPWLGARVRIDRLRHVERCP